MSLLKMLGFEVPEPRYLDAKGRPVGGASPSSTTTGFGLFAAPNPQYIGKGQPQSKRSGFLFFSSIEPSYLPKGSSPEGCPDCGEELAGDKPAKDADDKNDKKETQARKG